MKPSLLLFDTSVYVAYLRSGTHTDFVRMATARGSTYFSSVVLGELYAGTRSPRDKADLDIVRRTYLSNNRLIAPDEEDWCRAGQVLARYRRLFGNVEPRDHLNDILILLTAARVRCSVVTENESDYSRWTRLLRRMGTRALIRPVDVA